MDVRVRRPVRTRTQSLSPADFADIAACESVGWDGPALVVAFAVDLTADQRRAVVLRCITADAAEEATLAAAVRALEANGEYLAKDVTTPVQDKTQVVALTRQVQGLLRYVTRSGG